MIHLNYAACQRNLSVTIQHHKAAPLGIIEIRQHEYGSVSNQGLGPSYQIKKNLFQQLVKLLKQVLFYLMAKAGKFYLMAKAGKFNISPTSSSASAIHSITCYKCSGLNHFARDCQYQHGEGCNLFLQNSENMLL